MATILANIQSAARRTGLPIPATLIGTPKDYELQYLENFYALCEDLLSRGSWPQLKRTYTFTTTSASEYALPTDFWTYCIDAAWDTTNRWPLNGPVTDSRYAKERFWYSPSVNRPTFRIFGSQVVAPKTPFQMHPVNTGLLFSFDYISRTFIYDASGVTGKETVSTDTDISVFPDMLIRAGWRFFWLDKKGQDTTEAKALYERLISRLMQKDTGPVVSSRGARPEESTIINTPEGDWSV